MAKEMRSWDGKYQGWVRTMVDYHPSPYDSSALPFKAGQLIHVIDKREGGMWFGECNGKRGMFKCINVEALECSSENEFNNNCEKFSIHGLLSCLDLSSLTNRLELNGFDSIEKLINIDEKDLTFLEIENKLVRDRLMTAVEVIKWIKSKLPTESLKKLKNFLKGKHF